MDIPPAGQNGGSSNGNGSNPACLRPRVPRPWSPDSAFRARPRNSTTICSVRTPARWGRSSSGRGQVWGPAGDKGKARARLPPDPDRPSARHFRPELGSAKPFRSPFRRSGESPVGCWFVSTTSRTEPVRLVRACASPAVAAGAPALDESRDGVGPRRRIGIEGDRPDDVVEVVGDDDRPIGEPGAADAPAAEHLLEVLLVGAVIGDRGRRVLELVAGQDADDAVAGGDDPLLAEPLGPGHARGAGGLAAEAARRRPGPWRP